MLNRLHSSFQILAQRPPATRDEINALVAYFKAVPREFIELARQATILELGYQRKQYIRFAGPSDSIETCNAHDFHRWMPGAIPIGDDGCDKVLFYARGHHGYGLYHVGFGNLDLNDAVWIAPTLEAFLTKATGIETF